MLAFTPFVQVATYATRHFATFGLAPAATHPNPQIQTRKSPNLGAHVAPNTGKWSNEQKEPELGLVGDRIWHRKSVPIRPKWRPHTPSSSNSISTPYTQVAYPSHRHFYPWVIQHEFEGALRLLANSGRRECEPIESSGTNHRQGAEELERCGEHRQSKAVAGTGITKAGTPSRCNSKMRVHTLGGVSQRWQVQLVD